MKHLWWTTVKPGVYRAEQVKNCYFQVQQTAPGSRDWSAELIQHGRKSFIGRAPTPGDAQLLAEKHHARMEDS